MNILIRTLSLTVVVAVLAGCEAPAPTTRNFSHMRLNSTSRVDAFVAARQAMSERFRLAEIDPVRGLITSVPEETEEVGTAGQVGDVVGARRRVRKVARTHVSGSDTWAELWCKVTVERYETAERNMFISDQSGSDLPTETAAERGGATTAEQDAVWRTTHRDKVAERNILRAVREIVASRQETSATRG